MLFSFGIIFCSALQPGLTRDLPSGPPDLTAQPIGNGFPMGAVVMTADIAQRFNNGMELVFLCRVALRRFSAASFNNGVYAHEPHTLS